MDLGSDVLPNEDVADRWFGLSRMPLREDVCLLMLGAGVIAESPSTL